MAKRRRKKPAGSNTRHATAIPRDNRERKAWTILFYMCGDNELLDEFIGGGLAELCSVGSSRHVHVAVQCDQRRGARRYVLPEGPTKTPPYDKSFDNLRVNTGDPAEAIDFLLWGLEQCPSDHVAVIFSGLGINPAYVGSFLIAQERQTRARESAGMRIQDRLFSICHDQTSLDALEAHELSEILSRATASLDRPIDLVGFDLGVGAFVEIAYQLQEHADYLIASQTPLPDAGWPYREILSAWYQKLDEHRTEVPTDDGPTLARTIIQSVAERYPDPHDNVRMIGLDLSALEKVTRVLDTLSLAIMHTLGELPVLNAIRAAGDRTNWISPHVPQSTKEKGVVPDNANFLPAVDLFELLTNVEEALGVEAAQLTPDSEQGKRVSQLRELVLSSLDVLSQEPKLLLNSWPVEGRGLSVLLPPTRKSTNKLAGKPLEYSLSNSNYLKLNFSQQVHWSAMMGAFKLITEQPHVLWRLISSVLADASGPARDALLQRMVSNDSVIDGLKTQFKSLSSGAALTLSLEPRETQLNGQRDYVLRLESPMSDATVAEQTSRAYQASIDAALHGLEKLLQDPRGMENVELAAQLTSLGRVLGEDLISQLADRLDQEYAALRAVGTPHLRFQIPSVLMRYPWELMHDREGMLCERFALGRQVQMAANVTRRIHLRKRDPIRMLVIGDPKFDIDYVDALHKQGKVLRQLSGAQSEAVAVADTFELLGDELTGMHQIEVTKCIGERVTCFDMRAFLRGGFDLIHFAGHAQFDKQFPDESAWILSDGPLRASDIRNTLAWTRNPPWLVFANACEAGMDAGKPGGYQGDVYGLATAFINQSVAAYIAPLWPVDDAVATSVAQEFYYGLVARRLSLGEALFLAKRSVREGNRQDAVVEPRSNLSWATVILYGDPTRRLLESLWSAQAE